MHRSTITTTYRHVWALEKRCFLSCHFSGTIRNSHHHFLNAAFNKWNYQSLEECSQTPFVGISNRCFSSRRKKKRLEEDPFYVLGFLKTPPSGQVRVKLHNDKINGQKQPEIPYKRVKAQFLRIAMKHHPDTSSASSKEEQEADREIFVRARKAFESLIEGSDGIAILRSDEQDEEGDLSSWFKDETGHDMPFMDQATMKEVAEMTEKVGGESGGLDRDGGMWTLARMVTQSVKSGGSADSLLRLEAGSNKVNREIDGILRRKRRR